MNDLHAKAIADELVLLRKQVKQLEKYRNEQEFRAIHAERRNAKYRDLIRMVTLDVPGKKHTHARVPNTWAAARDRVLNPEEGT